MSISNVDFSQYDHFQMLTMTTTTAAAATAPATTTAATTTKATTTTRTTTRTTTETTTTAHWLTASARQAVEDYPVKLLTRSFRATPYGNPGRDPEDC